MMIAAPNALIGVEGIPEVCLSTGNGRLTYYFPTVYPDFPVLL